MTAALPQLSVIVPVFNGECYLAETLTNLLALGIPSAEVIVVDDGSTDKSAEIAASFGATVRLISQANAGPAAARNRGLEAARGEVIGLVDADDLWVSDTVQEALHVLLADEQNDIVQGRIQEFQGEGEDWTKIGSPYAYVNLGSALFRRGVFGKVGLFDPATQICDDYDWWIRAYDLRIPKRRIDATTLMYRIHSQSITHDRSLHDIGMASVHRKAAERRRRNADLMHTPPGYPSLVDFIGRGKAEGWERNQGAGQAAAGGGSQPHLERCDDKTIDLHDEAVVAFMVVRNEAKRLPHNLDYHRRLGVSRFFVVDNASEDGTLDWLLAQPDVHVWRTPASFRASRCGTDWTESLLRTYGQNRWCLVIDADELLVYPNSETKSLPALCAELEQSGYRAAMALMIDMYSDRPIRETTLQANQPFLDACRYFDRKVYHERVERFYEHDEHPSLFGGVRRRVFGGHEPGKDERYFYCLNKIPLLKYDPTFVLSDNLHWTNCRDVAIQAAALLHFKFCDDFVQQAEQEAERREHWQGGIQYDAYAQTLRSHPDLCLFDPALSVVYKDSSQLAAMGLLHPLSTHPPSESTLARPEAPMPDEKSQLLRQVRSMIKAQKSQKDHPYALAVNLLKQGRWSEAVAGFETAIAEAPGFAWSYHYLGDAYMAQRKWPEAIDAYQRAIELNPHFAASHFNLGEVYSQQERWPDAAERYRQALALQADLPNAARQLARALSSQAKELVCEAQKWYGQANALVPDDINIYHEASDLHPPDPDLCIQFADALARQNQRTKAIFYYQLALQVRPDDADTYFRLAKILQKNNDLANAIACCRQAIILDGEQIDYHLQLGALLLTQGEMDGAVKAYRRSLDLDPNQPALYKQMGDLLTGAGQIEEAAEYYAQAVAHGYQDY
ncbi:MAG: tetratricopeptide repeat protein [Caldilineales bacterium]|nr:tetratricopeptide repeat protein [Caldilineales bacterium]